MAEPSVAVLLPTYNERENIESLIPALFEQVDCRIFVVDDASPDGTAQTVERLQKKFPRLQLIKRRRRGRGSAGVTGFRAILKTGAKVVVEMDADFSHDPRDVPRLLSGLSKYDIVIGSRLMRGAKDQERGFARRLTTKLANRYLATVLQIPAWDITSGFRVYRREVLETVLANPMISTGPSIVVEVLYNAYLQGFYIGQVPIFFHERRKGRSKLGPKILLQSLVMPFLFRQAAGR